MPRLLTYNIHGCVGRLGRRDPHAVLEVIRSSGAEVVALQEVYDDGSDASFLRGLGSLGFATVVHGRTMRKADGHYGNVLMSRVEPAEVERIDLDEGGIEPRGAIRFRLGLDDGPLDVCATHLGLSAAERLRQLRRLEALLDAEAGPPGRQVLMGDLNEWRPASRFMRSIRRGYPFVSRVPTFPARRPIVALDRIAVRGSTAPVRFRRLDAAPADRASDHRPLLVEIG